MNHGIATRISLAALLLATWCQAVESAQATIYREGGKNITAWILTETFDGVTYALDNKGGQAKSELKRGQYLRIEYESTLDPYLEVGQKHLAAGEWAKAVVPLTKAAASAKYAHLQEIASLKLAEAYIGDKKFVEAVAACDALEKQAPRSPRLIDALFLKGRALALAGKVPEAEAVFARLKGMTGDAGPVAAAMAARGTAELLRTQGKFAEAAAALDPVIKPLDPVANASEWGGAAVELAGDLIKAGKEADALVLLKKVCFSAADGPNRARAHVIQARLLLAKPDGASAVAAFDQAALAAFGTDAGPMVRPEAKTLLKQAYDRIAKDPAISDLDKRDYRVNANRP